jgi:hypothetical protein
MVTNASAFRVLADVVVLAHLTFVLFVVLGAALVFRWPRIAWIHLPAAAWGAWIEYAGWICPLTDLENWLRGHAGEAVYRTTFIEQYLVPILYPPALDVELQWMMGSFVIAVNAAFYAAYLRRRARRRRQSEAPVS